jgi:cyclohexyl-isocyanide hydratase
MPLFNIGFVIFRDVTQLDFTGPLQVLSRLSQSAMHIIAKSAAPVPSDCGLGLVPTHTFSNCPPLDLICIPGGSEGVAGIINDGETIEFVRQKAGVRHLGLHGRICFGCGWSAEGATGYDALGH